ncbi:PREDICTED: F-box/LRR-repeat protein At2g43260-like isoform X1 [Brassica oleracea var. oleracea]|uniref:F-box domain-containing protein n=1 Tax=Brassica oleracea var. oleracea TaxID=109376 RepID=A0A0D3BPI9_BRAOL|nr:PREDICTED: F-box/LRR-repeat protein At2g43260-like isoform X1 [Brassica oleracea var. oleracea]
MGEEEEEEEEESSNSMCILPELLEEIFIRLPLKSILRFRTVSKHCRSLLESRRFSEKRMSLQKNRRILAAYNCDCGDRPRLLTESRFEGDEEIVYLHCLASRPSLSCDGLLCFPEQDWIIVLNPSTRQLRRFPSGLNHKCRFGFGLWSSFSPGNWAIGFGRDKVTGSFKVVRLCFSFRVIGQEEPVLECGVLDVQTGVWSKLSPPPHVVNPGSKSVCVNGSIYWLHVDVYVEKHYKILALDLHKQEFKKFPVPPTRATKESRLVNLEERLAFVKTNVLPIWRVEIWSTDTYQKRWSKTFSIHLKLDVVSWPKRRRWFTPVAVSKQGNLVFYDNQNKLFKYYPRTNETRCLSLDTCVISPYVENLVSLPLKPSHPYPHVSVETRMSRCRLFSRESSSWIFKALQRNEFRILEILFTSLVVAGYICSPRK